MLKKKRQDNDALGVPMITDSQINHADNKAVSLEKRQFMAV